jgi:NADH-quinone oxidoreductase subunit L
MNVPIILIPLFPLLGFLILGLGFRKIPSAISGWFASAMVIVPFIISLFIFIKSLDPGFSAQTILLFTWIRSGMLAIPFSFLIDQLSILMLLIVTGVGSLIHIYAMGYMKEDPGFNRFFAYMNLFVFFMLILVMGSGFPIMFIGWEGVGLCSYLLIGFWFKNHDFNNAAKKAFIMNRIGDLGFLLGMFLIYNTFGSFEYQIVFASATSMVSGDPTLTAITLLLFVGAVGKSAQIPLYTWLPDAMAGPTPVSALIHAATMVTAGVYMIARSNILYALSPFTMTLVGGIALATALMAASMALLQNDIKKILAYSTVSQLGYMMMGLSVGAFTGAMFHLMTHAFFKALLFLGAGSVIHALGGEQDIRNMGGLRKKLPKTWFTFLAATLAIAGIPPLSGFFSKDEILLHTFTTSPWVWGILLFGALLTAFYMFRLLWLSFSGNFRGTAEQQHHLHESPPVMTIPLMILALLAIFGGLLNLPAILGGNAWLGKYLHPVFAGGLAQMPVHPLPDHTTEWLLMLLTVFLTALTIYLTYNLFVTRKHGLTADGMKRKFLPDLIYHKYYIDELYNAAIVRPLLWLAEKMHQVIEIRGIDKLVNGFGALVIRTGNTLRYIQTGNVGFYMFMMILGVILILFLNILI